VDAVAVAVAAPPDEYLLAVDDELLLSRRVDRL
jgi:hypothetical protein